MRFGEVMRVLRLDRGWNEADAAKRARIVKQTWMRMETLERPDQMQKFTLFMVANNAFGYAPDRLIKIWRAVASAPAKARPVKL